MKKPVFQKKNSDWISELPSVIKRKNNSNHNSTEIIKIEACKKVNEKLVYSSLKDKRLKLLPKFYLGQCVRTSDTIKNL